MSSLFESLEKRNVPSFEMKEGQTMREFLSWFEMRYPKKEDYNFIKVLSPEGVATFFPLDPSKEDVPNLLQEYSEEEGYLGNVILSKDAKKGFISAEEQLQKGQGEGAEITTNTYTVSGELFTSIEVEDTEILDENGQKVSVPLAKISYDIFGEKGTLTPMEANALARVEDEFFKVIDKRKNTYEMTDLMMRAVLKQVAQVKKQDKKELSFDEFQKIAENVFYADKDVQEDVQDHIKHHRSARRLYNFSVVVVAIGRALTLVNGGLSYANSINTARMENGSSSQNSQAKYEAPIRQMNQAEEEVQVAHQIQAEQSEVEQNAPETTRFQYSSGAVRVDGELKWQYSGEINGMPFHGIMDEDPAQTAEEEADHFLSLTEKREIRRTAILQDMQAKLGIKTQEASMPSNTPEATISAPETVPELVAEEAAVAAAPVQAEQTEAQAQQQNDAPQTTAFQYDAKTVRMDGEIKWQYSGEINGMPFQGVMDEDPAIQAQEEAGHPLSILEKQAARRTAIAQDMQAKLAANTQEASAPSVSPEPIAEESSLTPETSQNTQAEFPVSMEAQDENKPESQPIITGHLDKNGNMTWERTEYGKEQLDALHHPIKAKANGVLDALKTSFEQNFIYNIQDGENKYSLDDEPFESKGVQVRNLKIKNENGAVITLPIEEKSYQEALSQKGVSEADIMKKMARDLLQEHPITENMIGGMSEIKTVNMQETPQKTPEVPLNAQEKADSQPFFEKMKETVLNAFNRPFETDKTPEPKEPMEVVDILPMGYGLQKEKELQQKLKEATSNTVKKKAIKPLTGTPVSQGSSQAIPVITGAPVSSNTSSLQSEDKEERKGRMASLPHEEISFGERKKAYEKTQEKMKILEKNQVDFNTAFETAFDEQKGEIKVHLSPESYITDDGVETSYFAKEKDNLDIERALKLAMLQKEKGFDSLLINGKKEFQEQMFLASKLVGIEVKGYIPSKETLDKLEVLKADEVIKKVINVQANEDMTGSIIGLKNNQTR